ncbi:MAG: hypothetical protein IJD35_00015 [Clostridia bacterium]|nr:hypothetical protein [Clostridia bacterium]
MKKIIAILMILVMVSSVLMIPAFAKTQYEESSVYVSITDHENKLAYAKVKVFDYGEDGEFSVNEALYYAHVWYYEGGASAGYKTKRTEYGRTLTKLWGNENGTGFGYYVNDEPATSMEMSLKEGDHVHAFVYTDTENFSDTYSYFDKTYFQVKKDESVTLTLKAVTYDENWNPISVPVRDAYVTLNGEKTDFRTDEEGKVTVTFEKGGKTLVGAVSDSMTLVQPSCLVRVEGGFTLFGLLILLLALLVAFACFGAWFIIAGKKKKLKK